MNCLFRSALIAAFLLSPVASELSAQTPPPVKTLNTPRTFPAIKSRAEWKARAEEIREQVLVSCGLWPLPEKTPLNAQVFGKVERDGYSIEKVYLEAYPGFYLAGNLYRPLGRGTGPFPGVLNPHGHWENGRMADNADGSIAARCISFARQGMVAFTYDMVGYNDTRFPDWAAESKFPDLHWVYGTNRVDQLWNISLMGLQTWNSIRALDFLESLADVDQKRLACTGESGGGTQTFMLGAVDDRLAAQVPVVMVSHTMQGGCLCENAPGLRVEHYNVEIAAAAAPRPQLIVAAAGDWTKKTMEVEGPAVESVYRLYGAPDKLKYVRFEYNHNYNQTSREAVYDWLGHRLLKNPEAVNLKEQPYKKDPDAALRVFPDNKLPANALPMDKFVAARKQAERDAWQKLVPQDKAGVKKFNSLMLPAWRHTVQTSWSPEGSKNLADKKSVLVGSDLDQLQGTVLIMARVLAPGESSEIRVVTSLKPRLAILSLPLTAGSANQDEFSKYFTTYNRTELQRQTDRLIEVCEAVRQHAKVKRVVLAGQGQAGLWALLAAPAADAVVADCAGLDVTHDETLITPGLFAPGLRAIGTFEGAAMLAAPHPLVLHNTKGKFAAGGIQSTYRALSAERKLVVGETSLPEEQIMKWAGEL